MRVLDTDSLSSALVFSAFLSLFTYLCLLEHSGNPRGASIRNGWRRSWTGPLLPVAKYGCVIAVALSGLALVHSLGSVAWWPVSLLSLGLLAALWGIDRATAHVALRHPALATRWYRSLSRILPGRPWMTSNTF